eukprot:gene5324-3826_t
MPQYSAKENTHSVIPFSLFGILANIPQPPLLSSIAVHYFDSYFDLIVNRNMAEENGRIIVCLYINGA